MPKLVQRVPSLRRHASGQAVVTLAGRDFYVGPFGSKESRREYERLVGEFLANGRRLPASLAPAAATTIDELILAYWRHASSYYSQGDSGEINSIKRALSHLRRLYGGRSVAEFGPLALQAVRQSMVTSGWCRSYVNGQVGRLKRAFKWGVEQELVPPHVFHGLQCVTGLRIGRTEAPEPEPVRPVPEAWIPDIQQHVSPQVRAMISLQLLTGMRPGEVVSLRGAGLDTTGHLWVYRPARHKTAHHGHQRSIYIGPRAQEILRPFLKPDLTAYLFSPADAERARRGAMREARKTPVQPSQVKRAEMAKRRRRRRPPRDRFDVSSYRRAISRACQRAFPPPEPLARRKEETLKQWKERLTPEQRQELKEWHLAHSVHPHQFRHNAATRLRKEFGLEAAQVILGHRTLSVTELYAQKNVGAAQRIMEEVG